MNSDILTTKVFLLFLTLSVRKFLHIPQINLSHVHIKKCFNASGASPANGNHEYDTSS